MNGLERWKDIPGYEELYQVSDQGRVRSVDRVVPNSRDKIMRLKGRILRNWSDSQSGHLEVGLSIRGVKRTISVHRLVALAWIGPRPVGHEVCHGPAGLTDNSVGNLSYGNKSKNALDRRRDNTHCGKSVKRSDGREFISMAVAAEESGCFAKNIWKVCNGQRNMTGGYGWAYV